VVMRIFGDSPTAVRMPSVIAGSLAVLAIFHLGRLLYGVRTGLLAAALLAISTTSIFYSQEARSYAWLLLLSIASSYYFAQVFLPKTRAAPTGMTALFLYCVLAIGLVYSHYYGLLVVATHWVVAVLGAIRGRRSWPKLSAFLVIGFAYLPWLPAFLEHLQIRDFWIERPTGRHLLNYLAFAFNGQIVIAGGAAAICALALLRVALLRRRSGPEGENNPLSPVGPATVWLVLWIVLPIAAAYGKSQVSTPVFTNRNLIICFPPMFLLTAHALSVLADTVVPDAWKRHIAGVGCLVILAAGIMMLFGTGFYREPNRPQYREAVQVIIDSRIPFDQMSIVVTDEYFYYHFGRMTPGLYPQAIAYQLEQLPATMHTLALRDSRFVWYLQGFTRTGRNDVRDRLEADYALVMRQSFAATEVSLFEKR